ncbi:RNA-directed DNA polymerase, partial [Chloroflexota bacterium]
MPLNNYEKLKETLNLQVAIDWLINDVKDDFYPDPIRFADIKKYKDDYLTQRQHRLLQIDSVKYHKEYIPKKSSMLREAIWLHPTHRILYLAILYHFFEQLDPQLLPCSFAFRCNIDADQDDYPFNKKIEGWKQFKNNYRNAAVQPSMKAILVTDLSSYYDHISCEEMSRRIHNLLGSTISRENRLVLNKLKELLTLWSNDSYGIPQNHDPSSFLGNLYLHNIDHEMSALGYRYFRFVDDIRVVTETKEQAILALHNLQRALLKHRLFLATEKTHIYTREDPKFNEELDVTDDVVLSEAERTINKGCYDEMEALVDELFIHLEKHAGRDGEDRKFRAYSNRLLNAAQYSEIRGAVIPKLHEFAIPRLKSHPYRSDSWVKMLRVEPSSDVVTVIQELLVDKPSI